MTARARVEAGRVREVSFVNVPSFVAAAEQRVQVPGLGELGYTLAYGGAYYAYVDVAPLGLSLEPAATGELIAAGRAIKRAVAGARTIEHPSGEDGLGFLYGTIFVGPPRGPGAHSRNVCIFADGEVDRSPTGTGVSGRAAIEHARGQLPAGGEWIRIESILGTCFDVRVRDELMLGEGDAAVRAVIPEVRGTAHITGRHEFLIDPEDPLRAGVLLR